MLRLKLVEGGEINIHIEKIVSFSNTETGSLVIMDNGTNVEVQESCQKIRNDLKKLGFDFN